ncbi:MAG: methyl-accepting chemotaxis protein [Erythrobacter sp.]|jgi:methyl-accepting chemotaxis protein|nr:methyl-accepting chemotaxis protein [Erythrobacter sp.]
MTKASLNDRLDFYGVDDATQAALRSARPVLNKRLGGALDHFYATVSARPELAAHFKNAQQMERARGLQAEHWTKVCIDGIDQRFHDRATNIGSVHARIGLEPNWYIGAYALVLEHLVFAMVAPGWQRILPWKRAQARRVVALLKVALIDIDLALSAYFDRSKAETEELLNNQMGTALAGLASGDLTIAVTGFPKEYKSVEHKFNDAVGKLAAAMANVREGAEGIDAGSNEIRSASDDLARRTQEQAANLEESAAAIAQTTQRIAAIADNTQRATTTIETATTRAGEGTSIVSQAVDAMDQISQSSAEITNIISVIDSIAFQTNLLALNAGVEAARAGETGKGFAVVASEVRALAQRCTQAADEVKALISSSSQHVTSGVDLVKRSGEAFAAINEQIIELNATIEDIASATQTQSTSLRQVNSVVADLDRSTQQNAAMSEQCNAAAASLVSEAERLRRAVGSFRIDHEGSREAVAGETSLAA